MSVYPSLPSSGRSPWLQPSLRLRLALRTGALVGLAVIAMMMIALVASAPIEGAVIVVCIVLLIVLVILSLLGSYAIAGRVLAPLHAVTVAARRLSTDSLDNRLNYVGPDDEIKELADTFDQMLDRLSAAFGSQRRFVANASHELRTPLAVMRTEIDVTLADPQASIDELRRMGRVVRDASQRANELIEALLLLARTEAQAGRRLNRQALVDLSVGVPGTLKAVQAEIKRLNLNVTTQFSPAPVMGDPSLLERLAGNLIENAVRYNVHHGHLSVRSYAETGRAVLVVTNSGPELDSAEIPGLFEPFRRGGIERTGTRGSGLGLSIVRAVVDAHGGQIQAAPHPGGGMEIGVYLPLATLPTAQSPTVGIPAAPLSAPPNRPNYSH